MIDRLDRRIAGRTRTRKNVTPRLWLAIAVIPGSLLSVNTPAAARDWWVDGVYGNSSNPGTEAAPIKFFYRANAAARPGDTIHLKPSMTYPTLWVSASGTAGHPITITGSGSAPNLTKVSGGGGAFGIQLSGSYLVLSDLDVTAPGPHGAIHVPEGFHDDTIMHNRVHDAGLGGIDTVGADYITIAYNTVYNTSHYTGSGIYASGISVKGSYDVDGYLGVKMRITGNVIYANTNVPTCYGDPACLATAPDSDGSGIIIDNNRRTYGDNVAYRGRTLIANNVVFGNGGRGIHMYLSDHIAINGNTLYHNNQDFYEGSYRAGEIVGAYVSDISVYNNILDSDGLSGYAGRNGSHVAINFAYCTTGTGRIQISNNLGYRPQNDVANFFYGKKNTIPIVMTNNYWGNPAFAGPSLDPHQADFRVSSASPALAHGQTSYSLGTDLLGVRRRLPTTIGAYEIAMP